MKKKTELKKIFIFINREKFMGGGGGGGLVFFTNIPAKYRAAFRLSIYSNTGSRELTKTSQE